MMWLELDVRCPEHETCPTFLLFLYAVLVIYLLEVNQILPRIMMVSLEHRWEKAQNFLFFAKKPPTNQRLHSKDTLESFRKILLYCPLHRDKRINQRSEFWLLFKCSPSFRLVIFYYTWYKNRTGYFPAIRRNPSVWVRDHISISYSRVLLLNNKETDAANSKYNLDIPTLGFECFFFCCCCFSHCVI